MYYWRKKGVLVHKETCSFDQHGVCTCGLIDSYQDSIDNMPDPMKKLFIEQKKAHDQRLAELTKPPVVEITEYETETKSNKDVHTEHCCKLCGCKYGKDDCPVETGVKKQSYECGGGAHCGEFQFMMEIDHECKKWRKKDGKLIHDGDCHFWSIDICTCGLLHHLFYHGVYPDNNEMARHDSQTQRVLVELPPKPYVPPTKEEIAAAEAYLNEVFKRDDKN